VIEKRIREWARRNGMLAAVAGLDGLSEARDRLGRLESEGLLDAEFTRLSLRGFLYLEGCRVEKPQAIVMLAVPRPAHVVTFQSCDGDLEMIAPPTYAHYRSTFDEVCAQLRADLGLSAREIDLISAPLKSLAALSGLIRYGRNNLGYAPGLGSYFQLIGLAACFPPASEAVSDIEEREMERCRNCLACANACPTGAIEQTRFLLHAQRCYTFFSESPDPIPESIPVPETRCIMGCMICQEVCPENKGLLIYERSGIVFSHRETEAMLGDPLEREVKIWKDIRDKFALLDLSGDTGLFARNLRYLTRRPS
jgi:epoxyqueuosine reductase